MLQKNTMEEESKSSHKRLHEQKRKKFNKRRKETLPKQSTQKGDYNTCQKKNNKKRKMSQKTPRLPKKG